MTKKVFLKYPSYTYNPTSTLHTIGYGDGGPNTNEKFLDIVAYINKAITDGLVSTVATYKQLDLGKLQAIGLEDQVSYEVTAGKGTITLYNPWSFRSMVLLVNVDASNTSTATKDVDGSGNFDLVLEVENGVYNQWAGNSLEEFKLFDLWIPQIQVWGAGPTVVGQQRLENITLDNQLIIAPQIVYEENKITYKFLGSSDFGSQERVIITIT